MTAPDPTEGVRKLRQHDNEFESVYDLLRVVDGKVDTLEAKAGTLEAKFDTLEGKFGTLEGKFDAGFERLDVGFERLNVRSERLESGQQQILDLLRGRQQGDTTTE